ncbi:diguanylate cyclase [Erythrobacter sp. YT30]|uniref:GGDEF domain-containing protein n=1 Tax=Erythrobacter sp. YT30 TaxID=1735012 RepID=UPI00076D40F3|nr:GGDEF domain-containing protein [Erythrobacter sp. YT30]KWV91662.1 hypothetical protein AUC45_10645 [Erythrobacter sp. YT30]
MATLSNLQLDGEDDQSSDGIKQPSTSPRVLEARLDLLARISQFTTRHDLEVNAMNLSAICGALSGSNAQLAEIFAKREMSGQPIDQRWLDEVIRQDPEVTSRLGEIEKLMDQLEYALIRFGQTAKSAKDESGEYRGAIDANVKSIAKVQRGEDAAGEISRVVDLSRSVIERIEQVEAAMEKSQFEADQLRENLAKARMEADIDHLTGLPNRRAFERRLVTATERALAQNEPLCVGFCDVDNFKQINDRHGHDAGDRILCAIANTLSANADDQCFVARHGGEEFVVLFYGLDKDAAYLKLDRIRRAQAAKLLMDQETGRPFGKVTFSAGIAQVEEGTDTRAALARADRALYDAKAAGRNRITAV